MPLQEIAAFRLEVPLTKPYRLAFGVVECYDTIMIVASDRDGRTGMGEATVLTGYTDETIADAWRLARELARELVHAPRERRGALLTAAAAAHPFTATAFGTALEMLESPELYAPAHSAKVPLLGLIEARGEDAIAAELERLLEVGFRTLKLKVGFDARADARFVRDVQRAARGRVRIRIDANQGYSAGQAIEFVRALDPGGIELFEQPCAAGDWDAHCRVAGHAGVPLMLDESIYGIADIERAARLGCAQYIKLKLMKVGTARALTDALGRIRALGMTPVLGNGVACDIGCWHEALVAARHIDNAGEMNGFLKIGSGLLEPPLTFRDGAIRLESADAPRLDWPTVERYCMDFIRCPAQNAGIATASGGPA